MVLDRYVRLSDDLIRGEDFAALIFDKKAKSFYAAPKVLFRFFGG